MKEGFIKKWVNYATGYKSRYFVVTPEFLLYYKVKNGQILDKGQISLKLARIDTKTMNDRKMVVSTGTGQIHLEFSNIPEKREWMEAIITCKNSLLTADTIQVQQQHIESLDPVAKQLVAQQLIQ